MRSVVDVEEFAALVTDLTIALECYPDDARCDATAHQNEHGKQQQHHHDRDCSGHTASVVRSDVADQIAP